jgi:hypothetical protein
MTDASAIITAFLAAPAGTAVKALLVATFLVFLLGTFAALRDKTFNLQYVDAFVRTTILGRVAPVTAVLFIGYFADDQLITGAGVAAAAIVAAGMVASALASIRQISMAPEQSAAVNEVPKA